MSSLSYFLQLFYHLSYMFYCFLVIAVFFKQFLTVTNTFMLITCAFKKHLMEGGYYTLSEVKFQQRTKVRPQRNKKKTNLALHHTLPPNSSKSQRNLTKKWFLKQPLLNQIFKEPPITSHTKGRSLKDILVRAKI